MKLPKISIPNIKPVPRKGLECLNCEQPLSSSDNFCSYCGQKNSTKKLSFGVFLSNLFSGFFSYDSRFWSTFIPLLTKPGKVSKEFIEGKRVKFVNPFQLYLNVSIIFFIILGVSNRFSEESPFNNVVDVTQKLDTLEQVGLQNLDSIKINTKEQISVNIENDSLSKKVVTDLDSLFDLIEEQEKKKDTTSKKYEFYINNDSLTKMSFFNKISDFYDFFEKNRKYPASQALDSLGYEKSFWNKFYYEQTANGYKNIEQFKEDRGASFYKNLISKISIALFIFLPVFTLFLMLIYIRRQFTYMEHLVFVFHTQTVFFLLLSFFYFLNFFVELSNFGWVFIILFLIYLYKALRHFYGQRRFKTIVKFVLLNSYYLFLASIGFGIVAIVAFTLD
jgi:hypothetical protein